MHPTIRMITICVAIAAGVDRGSGADVFQMPAGVTSLETVVVGDPGNAPDDNGLGAVPYPYRIACYEVTAAQYAEFLNAKGRAEPDGSIWKDAFEEDDNGVLLGCEIRRQGEAGAYTYTVGPESANRPVSYVTFWDACRFCNWLHNGQGDGDMEDGAYTLRGYAGFDGRRIRRNPGARWFIPNEDEWYKAAYYDPAKPGGAGYWDYPTRSDARPDRDPAGRNAANWFDGGYLDPRRHLTAVGAFRAATSGFGTHDQAGNVAEWTEGLEPPFLRRMWGGAACTDDGGINRRLPNGQFHSRSWMSYVGFRVAGTVPDAAPLPAQPTDAAAAAPRQPGFPRRPWANPDDGRPFFPLGWFTWTSTPEDLDAMAAEGVNTVVYVSAPTDVDEGPEQLDRNLSAMTAYLDHAHARGIKVLIQCGWFEAFQDADEATIGRIRTYVETVGSHPALLGYQIYDEPEYKAGGGLAAEAQRELTRLVDAFRTEREAIRRWDPHPHHSIQVVFNLVPLSSWTAYLPVIDAFQIDRYPLDIGQAHFGHRGDWGPLIMAWSIAHGVAALQEHPHLHNPAPCMQGVGSSHAEAAHPMGVWRNPLYEETRYMAYSSLTVGGWGVIHWIRNISSPAIRRNVATLHAELRRLVPAFEQSWQTPPFTVRHNHEGITRDFLSDCVPDVSTLALEDDDHYYLIVVDNSGTFTDLSVRLTLPAITDDRTRSALVLNEDWSRPITYDAATGEWVLATHAMCFGDVNVWMIRKSPE